MARRKGNLNFIVISFYNNFTNGALTFIVIKGLFRPPPGAMIGFHGAMFRLRA